LRQKQGGHREKCCGAKVIDVEQNKSRGRLPEPVEKPAPAPAPSFRVDSYHLVTGSKIQAREKIGPYNKRRKPKPPAAMGKMTRGSGTLGKESRKIEPTKSSRIIRRRSSKKSLG